MLKLNQKGIAHILVLVILLLGLVVGVYLVKQTQVFKPKAYEGWQTDPNFDLNKKTLDSSIKNFYTHNLNADLMPEYKIVDYKNIKGDGLNFSRRNAGIVEYQSACDVTDPHRLVEFSTFPVGASIACPSNYPLCKQFAPGVAGCVSNISEERGHSTSVYKYKQADECIVASFGSINDNQATCVLEKKYDLLKHYSRAYLIGHYKGTSIQEINSLTPDKGSWCDINLHYPGIVNDWLNNVATASDKIDVAECLKSPKVWVPPQCIYGLYGGSGTYFSGCSSSWPQGTCSDWGSANDSNWTPDLYNKCKEACSGGNHSNSYNNYCANHPKPVGNWTPPTCSDNKFYGCTLTGTTCQDWGQSNYEGWSTELYNKCKIACSVDNHDSYCTSPYATVGNLEKIANATSLNSSSDITKKCPVNDSCCTIDAKTKKFQTCGTGSAFNKEKGIDTSCPTGYHWCYSGYCINENYNPATNSCLPQSNVTPTPSSSPASSSNSSKSPYCDKILQDCGENDNCDATSKFLAGICKLLPQKR